MSRKGKRMQLVVQVCQECGEEFPIWRLSGKLKTESHVKHMYCPVCMKVTAHKQRRELDA